MKLFAFFSITFFALASCGENKNSSKNNEDACQEIVADKPANDPLTKAQLKKRFLDAHNKDRARYGVPALSWSTELENYAQAWANYLRDNNQCKMAHRSSLGRREGKKFGENLAWYFSSAKTPDTKILYTPEKVVYSWDSECVDYKFSDKSCTSGKQCGHFTQSIWKTTTKVGCGFAMCNEGQGTYTGRGRAEIWVCNYDPPGNIIFNGKKLNPYGE